MTPEEAIITSEPEFIATDTDKNGIAYYGCSTVHGRFGFKVEADKMHAKHHLTAKSSEADIRIAKELIDREMLEMRKVLLWNCIGHLVTDEVGKQPSVMKFVAETLYTPSKPRLVTRKKFEQMFKAQ